MTRPARSRIWSRLFAPVILLGVAAPVARAQDPVAGAASEGNPVPGYVATGLLAGAAIFVLCKSARR